MTHNTKRHKEIKAKSPPRTNKKMEAGIDRKLKPTSLDGRKHKAIKPRIKQRQNQTKQMGEKTKTLMA